MNELVLFESKDGAVTLSVQTDRETVWLNRGQLAELFGRDVKTIGKHIANALKEELDDSTVAKFATVQEEGERTVERMIEYYNLDMVISVGYRVKSQRGVEFRRWARLLFFYPGR
ncbi:MAG: virulence RhuM family protein [Proteobacteria bacterium]|nr:virulence RhuM family protein [Pseudomonadota bacterium]